MYCITSTFTDVQYSTSDGYNDKIDFNESVDNMAKQDDDNGSIIMTDHVSNILPKYIKKMIILI